MIAAFPTGWWMQFLLWLLCHPFLLPGGVSCWGALLKIFSRSHDRTCIWICTLLLARESCSLKALRHLQCYTFVLLVSDCLCSKFDPCDTGAASNTPEPSWYLNHADGLTTQRPTTSTHQIRDGNWIDRGGSTVAKRIHMYEVAFPSSHQRDNHLPPKGRPCCMANIGQFKRQSHLHS